MFSRSKIAAVAAATLTISAAASFAQQPTMGPDDALAAAKNQLGVLEYCEAQGHTDKEPVEIQTKMMGMMPAPTDEAKIEAAYEKGKAGTISALGVEQSLAETAKAQSTDEAALCKQMSDMIKQAAAQMPQ